MKNCNFSVTGFRIVCTTAYRSLAITISMLAIGLNLAAQTATLVHNDDGDFNKGYLNDMVVTDNSVILPYLANDWGGFTETAALPKALRNHQATYWNNLVFVTGGLEVITIQEGTEVVDYSRTVYVADVGEGLTNWREGPMLPEGVSEHAAVIANGYLYVMGGMSDSVPTDKIFYAKLRADGSLRPWEESAVTLPVPLWGHTAEVLNGRIFVAGGSNNADTTAVNSVYSCQINPDGTLSAFTTEANVLPGKRNNHTMLAYEDRLYILGGYNETLLPVDTIFYADVSVDGTLGTWQFGGTLPEPLFAHSSTIQNGTITLLGGYNDDKYFAVQYGYMADITTGPSFNWTQSGLYFEHWAGSAAIATNGKVFTVGGIDIFKNTLSQCYYNTLYLSGTDRASSGQYISPVFELGIDRTVSSLAYNVLNQSNYNFYYRTAADGGEWSIWNMVADGGYVSIDSDLRYVQYMFEIFNVSGDHQEALDTAILSFNAIQLAGVISTSQTWTQANSPYWVTDDVFLTGEDTITVEPGTTIMFGEGTKLEVQNAWIKCDGNSEGWITFTSFTGEDGYWKGLYFTNGSSGHNSLLDYVVIENAGFQDFANLNIYGTDQPTMTNSILQYSTNKALYVNGGWPVLNNVTFADNGGYVIEAEAGGTGDINDPVFTGNEIDAVHIIGGTISNNAIWDNFGLEYHISGNISIWAYSWNPRLTIDKGLTLRFPAGCGISVGGNYYSGGELWAEGTADPDSLITFTSLNGEAGGWNGVYFDYNSDDYGSVSSLKYCLIEKANNYNVYSISSTQPTMENCTVTNSLHKGIQLNSSSPTITNCEVYNHPEEGLLGDSQCDITVTGSDFHNNGGDGLKCGGNITIMNSDFYDNTGAGLHLTGYLPNVENVVIQNNGSHGIWATDCDPDFVNVDVLNNAGHGFYMNANVWPEYYDLVLSGNLTNDLRVSGGTVNHPVTWQVKEHPFIIIGTFTIGGSRLTLEKGLTLRFAEGTGIEIGAYYAGGELWAEGTYPDSVITFTSLNGLPGGWNGLNFNYWSSYGESYSILRNCLIEKGDQYNISAQSTSQPDMQNCTISNSLHKGIVLSNASPLITNCEVFGNPEEGLYGNGECNTSINGSNFYNNGGDGFNCGGSMFILDCSFHDNTGTGLHLTGGAPELENVVVQNNGGHGLHVTDCDPDFINVDVLNNAGHGFLMNANVLPEYFDLVLSGNATNDFRVSGGQVNHPVTWKEGQYPFIVIDPFSIGGARLTLEKGLTLWFAEGTGIEVGGYYSGGELWAEGAADPDSLITFTSLNGKVGGWNGINFNYWANYNETVSYLKNCIIERGNDYNLRSDQNNQPSIDSCIIRESAKYGIELYYANPAMTHSQIVNNTSYGIYIYGDSNPVIGNAPGMGNDIFNNGQYNIYNDNSNNIDAAYNYWGTTDDALIQQRIYDFNDNAGLGTVLYATVSTESGGLLGHYLSLQAKYANLPGTILDDVYVSATGLGDANYEFTSRTNKDGYSTFTMMPDQDYALAYATERPWGGGNGTDALRVMQHFSAIRLLSGIHLAAANVNGSESVNSTDALLIMQRFAHMINSFTAGDWVFETDGGDILTIEAADRTDTIRGLCYGDVNGSYIPGAQLKSGAYPVGISQKGEMSFGGTEVDIPFYASADMQLGAMSLVIHYPASVLDIEDLKVNNTGGQVIFNAENGTLLAAWISLEPMQVKTTEPLFYVTARIKDMDALKENFRFLPGENSELADGNAQVITGINLYYPALVTSSPTGDAALPANPVFGMDIWPNPFSNRATMQYTMPEAGDVSLKIYNSLGMLVKVLVEGSRDAGSYTEQWDATSQPSGIYYYILDANTGRDTFHQSGKLILKRQ